MTFLPPGTLFAGHRIVRLLGTGRVAHVYEVLDPAMVRRALKLLKNDVALEAKLHARLSVEGQALAEMDSAHVVRFYAAGIEDGRVWILMELVEGKNLAERIAEAGGPLGAERAVRLIRQVCEGVAAAHDRNILHRDLRPGNILVTDDDAAKITDFGLAKLEGYDLQTTNDMDPALAAYRAPEYLTSGKAELASDVYSLGVILYEALSGKNPFAEVDNLATTILKQSSFTPPKLDSLGLRIPHDVSELVRWALEKDPERRCSLDEMRMALDAALRLLQSRHRAKAAGLAMPGRPVALAPTEPGLPVMDPTSKPPGTAGDAGRSAVLPPASARSGAAGPGSAPRVPATQPLAAVPSSSPVVAGPTSPAPASAALPVTLRSKGAPSLRTVPLEAYVERRSSGIPVERPAPPPREARRARGAIAGGVVTVVLAASLGVGWTLARRDDPAPAGPAASPAPASPASASASLPAPRPAEAPTVSPATSASASRPKPAAPGPRRGKTRP